MSEQNIRRVGVICSFCAIFLITLISLGLMICLLGSFEVDLNVEKSTIESIPCNDAINQKCSQLMVNYSYSWLGSTRYCQRIEDIHMLKMLKGQTTLISIWSSDQCPPMGQSTITYYDLEWTVFIGCCLLPIIILVTTEWIDHKVDQAIQRYRHQHGILIPTEDPDSVEDLIQSESESDTEIEIVII